MSGGRRNIDLAQLREAVAGPRNDTREWVKLATVIEVGIDAEGMFADVLLEPEGVEDTVRVGSIYAGNGFGFYAPLAVDDQVLVAFPDGDSNVGGWVISRAWSTADPPPVPLQAGDEDPSSNVVLWVAPDKHLTLKVTGSGNINLQADAGKVCVGDVVDASGTEPIAKGTTLKTWMAAVRSWLLVHTHIGVMAGPGVTGVFNPATGGQPPATPEVEAAKGRVR
jgi:hypothetical protein